MDKAVYGLRVSPKWWADERDSKLATLRWESECTTKYLEQSSADSQIWLIREKAADGKEVAGQAKMLLGIFVVYLDDVLLQLKKEKLETTFWRRLGHVGPWPKSLIWKGTSRSRFWAWTSSYRKITI